jgi:LmbE family N-acetylglucosaminyl deacetylase
MPGPEKSTHRYLSISTPLPMNQASSQPFVLLAVLAHPDDETFGTGGTLALYAQRGVKVHLVCATRGEAGEADPQHLQGYSSVAELRECELHCAADILGLSGLYFLGYRDSGMAGSPDNRHLQALAAQPTEAVAAQIVQYIRKLKPQVVITFDPIGGYKHPDHIAIYKATLMAYHLAGDATYLSDQPPYQPQKLYYYTPSKRFLRFMVQFAPLLGTDPRHMGRNKDIDFKSIVDEGDFPIHAYINVHSVYRQKEAASACHASQLQGVPSRRGILTLMRYWMSQTESYMRADPLPEKGLREKDLFAGVTPDLDPPT